MNLETIPVLILLFLIISTGPTKGENKFAHFLTKVSTPMINFINNSISSGLAKTMNNSVNLVTGALKCNPNESVPISVPFYTLDDEGNIVKLDFTEKPPSNKTLTEVEKATRQIEFYLYTRETQNEPETIAIDNSILLYYSKWKSSKPTVFSTHGFHSSYLSGACQYIKDAFLEVGDYNVVLMNWKDIAKGDYVTVASSVKYVARTFARLIKFFVRNNMDPNTTIVVGHSLGAHVAGIGSLLSKANIHYVVGLDPAGPLFEYKTSPSELISPISGQHVDIIHTNAGQLGIMKNVGKHDFYINGGRIQPNCSMDPVSACSHTRSWEFFSQAVRHSRICLATRSYSYACFKDDEFENSILQVAEPNMTRPIGRYYMLTLGAIPYCIGDCGIAHSVDRKCIDDF